MSDSTHPFEVEPSVGNHFAWMRTVLGLQRTLMAAVRTSVSLIGFGFTVAQFFDKVRGQAPEVTRAFHINVPRDLGLVLIGAGVISLLVFVSQYHATVRYLRSGDLAAIADSSERSLHKPTYLVAWAVVVIGIAAFGSILLHF